jgi:hypothetical protein
MLTRCRITRGLVNEAIVRSMIPIVFSFFTLCIFANTHSKYAGTFRFICSDVVLALFDILAEGYSLAE